MLILTFLFSCRGKKEFLLEERHTEFLTSEETLRKWAGLSLSDRAARFHSKFPSKKITAMGLCRLYKARKIKRMTVRRKKDFPEHNRLKYEIQRLGAVNLVDEAISNGDKIVFCDEVNFTKTTVQRLEYTPCKKPFSITESDLYIPYVSVIASMSAEDGIELLELRDSAIDDVDFLVFLEKLRKKNPEGGISLFMDNLRVHKTMRVREAYDRLKITPIFNVAYQPDYNPIEAVFSQVKNHFKRMKVNKLLNDKHVSVRALIKESFKSVKLESIEHCVDRSLSLLRKGP